MGRFVGLGPNRGKGSGGSGTIIETTVYDRNTGITTDGSNNVTNVTLGENVYSEILYDNVGLVTSYKETIGSDEKYWRLAYDSNNLVTSIVEYEPPTYTAISSKYNVNETQTFTLTVNTTGVADGSQLWWKLEGVGSNPAVDADITPYEGTLTINSNTASTTMTAAGDGVQEGATPETFVLKVYGDSARTSLLSTTPTISLNDGDVAATVTPAANNVDEGSSLTINVSTFNVADGSTLYWAVSSASDFSTSSGNFTINSNAGSFTITPTADLATEGPETIVVYVYSDSGLSNIVGNSGNITINDTSFTDVQGQQAYTSPGTYSWTAPANVNSVCVVCIGGGGGGQTNDFNAGGGGGLGWKNNISVTPGQSYTVVVGDGGTQNTSGGTNGGDSYFINTSTVKGGGGQGNNQGGGDHVGDGGGDGGPHATYGGGGGAGGYSGDGNSGTGGCGGSGSNNGLTGGGAGGGGVGIYGEGSSGANKPTNNSYLGTMEGGGGGSGGSNGTNGRCPQYSGNYNSGIFAGPGGNYGGGGGGGTGSQYGTILNGNGGSGAVRIIWGSGRAFPSTNTADV